MNARFFFKHFPLPKYLKPSHIGISFSDSCIKAVAFNNRVSSSEPKSLVVPLEKGAIFEGSVANMEEVVKKISIIKKEFNSPFVFFTVPDELTYIFSVKIPVGKGSNAFESIAFTIEENVPLSLTETLFDFAPTEISVSENGHNASAVVAASVKKEIDKFVEVIKKGGFEAVGCIPESQAIATAVIPFDQKGVFCIVHARSKRVGIFLVRDGIVHFSTIRSVVEGDYRRQFFDEFEKFLEYYVKYGENKKNDEISSILVCGEFEYAKEVVESIYSSENNKYDAKLSNVWVNVLSIEKNPPAISYEDSLNISGPIGTILTDIV